MSLCPNLRCKVTKNLLCFSTPSLSWGDGRDPQYVEDGTKCAEGKVRQNFPTFKVAPYSYSTDQNMTYIDQNSITSRAWNLRGQPKILQTASEKLFLCEIFSFLV